MIEFKVEVAHETKVEGVTPVGPDALLGAIEAVERRRLIIVIALLGSGVAGAGIFAWLGIVGILQPPILAYGVAGAVLVGDLAGAVVLYVVQGKAIERLRAELRRQFPGVGL